MRFTSLLFSVFLSLQVFAATQGADFVPGEYVVRLKANYNVVEERSDLGALLGGQIKKIIPGQNIAVVIRPSFELTNSAVQVLKANPLVAVAEPNLIYHVSKIPNDPMWSQMWGMKNVGQPDSQYQKGVAGVDISAEKAWDIETGSKNIIVAVIDTGIDLDNPDLKENIWINQAEAQGQAGVDDDGNGFVDDIHGYDFLHQKPDPLDDYGHGTHCSGVIGAKGSNDVGVVGVVWNTQIMALKILDENGSGSLDNAIEAVDYATRMGAQIMSNSWGGNINSENLCLAIEKANKAGALFVAAAGNDSANNDKVPTYPASYDLANIISVAAVDNRGELADFSNYGRKSVDVGAPGVNVMSTIPGGYSSWSGTSMATPHVAGIAALLLSHEPKLSNVEIKNRIMATAKPMPGLIGKINGRGLVNAYTALTNKPFPPKIFWR